MFKFDTSKFMQRKINDKWKLILSTIHGRHHALRCHPQQQSTPMVPPSTGSNRQESGSSTGSRPQHHRKGERSYLHTIIQQGKSWATKAQQDLPINVTINSRLTCKALRVHRAKDSATSSWSLAFIILDTLISLAKYYVCTYKLEQAERWPMSMSKVSKYTKHNDIIIMNISISNSSNPPTVHQTYYEMTAMTCSHS
jgi:hypothetical protein